MPQTIWIACTGCEHRVELPPKAQGRLYRCPKCSTPGIAPCLSLVPVAPPQPQAAPAVPQSMVQPAPERTVPINITLPKVGGGVQTTVSQSTANDLAKFVVGGLVMAAGILLAAFIPGARGGSRKFWS